MLIKKEHLSISFLKTYVMNLDSYKKSDAMNFGSLVDCMLYTPGKTKNEFIIYNKDNTCKAIDENIDEYLIQLKVKDISRINDTKIENIEDFAEWLSDKLANEKAVTNKIKTQGTIDKYKAEFYEQILSHTNYINIISDETLANKIIITQKDFEEALKCSKYIANSEHMTHFLKAGKSEFQKEIIQKVNFEHGEESLKGIIDHFVINEESKTISIVDLKCTDMGIMEFKSIVDKLRYDLQAAFYVYMVKQMYNTFDSQYDVDFYWLVYSKKEERTVVYKASDEILERGRNGDKWKKGFMDLIRNYQLSHINNYPDFNYDYNSTKGFMVI